MTSQFSEIELSNCRLCGSPAQIDKVKQGPPLFRACCSNSLCLSGGTSWLSSKEAAAHVWNIRFNVSFAPVLKFIDAFLLFLAISIGITFASFVTSSSLLCLAENHFYAFFGVFSCWRLTHILSEESSK